MTRRPKLLISVFLGMTYRNLIGSNLLSRISESFDVTLVTSDLNPALIETLRQSGTTLRVLKTTPQDSFRSKILGVLELAQYLSFYDRVGTETMQKYVKQIRSAWTTKRIFAEALVLFASSLPPGKFFEKPYLWFARKRLNEVLSGMDAAFVLSTDGVWDKALTLAANRKGIPVMQLVHSWDNLPARGYLTGKTSKLLVWNERMKAEAQSLHSKRAENIDVIGVPQYERYLQAASGLTRESFLKSLGLPFDGKFVTYTCSAFRVFPDEDLFIERLHEISLKLGVTLVIRLHPTERKDFYIQKYSNPSRPGLIIDIPSGEFAASSHSFSTGDGNGVARFVGLMKFSSAVLNLASTITLDALLFDTPVICPAFNLDPKMDGAWNEASKWFESSHFKPIAVSGATSIVKSASELESALKESIESPSQLGKKRADLIEKFSPFQGKSHDQIVKSLQSGMKL